MDKIKEDFRNFLYKLWQHLDLPDPTAIQYDIAYYLQYGPKRLLVEAFRGVGKSWITSGFACWNLHRDPQMKILVVSASKERADAFSTFTKRLIDEMPVLQYLRPQKGQRDSMVAFDVGPTKAAHSPSVKSIGITGQLTGSRANLIIADDVETPKNSLTQTMRDKLSEAVKEFDAVLSPDGRIVYLGTPQSEESLYTILPERGYVPRIWPGRFPDDRLLKVHEGFLAPSIKEEIEKKPQQAFKPTEPSRFNEIDLLEREASYGRSGFALQFMLDPTLSDANRYPLKLSDLIVLPLNSDVAPAKVVYGSAPEQIATDLPAVGLSGDRWYRPMWVDDKWAEYQGCAMFIDPSGRGTDETTYTILKHLHGMLFLAECRGLTEGYSDDTMTKLAEAAKRQKVKHIQIESNFGDGMFTSLLSPFLQKIYPCTTEEVRHSTQKERRIIDTLEPLMNQHRLIVDQRVITEDHQTEDPKYQLFYQMTRVTKDRGALAHDDRLDSLAGCAAYWVDWIAKSVDKAAQEHRDSLLDKELQRFMENAVGRKFNSGPTWIKGR